MADHQMEPPRIELRTALQRYLREQLPDDDLQRVLRRWVGQRKANGLRAEELIMRFNEVWRSLPELQRVPPIKQKRLRERLVSTCISDYYQDVD